MFARPPFIIKSISIFLLALCLSACSSQPATETAINPISSPTDLKSLNANTNKPFIGFPEPDNYSICLHNTCSEIAFVSLSEQQWQSIEAVFYPKSSSAEEERLHIKQAIALFETYTGEQTGTKFDRAENNLSTGKQGQMDCIDEATNSTVYLRLLANADLLSWHSQASRTSRGLFSGNRPHNTATIIEIETQQHFAVDSWFEANGQWPHIVPLAEWKAGWQPEK
jgi:hypothetical protein